MMALTRTLPKDVSCRTVCSASASRQVRLLSMHLAHAGPHRSREVPPRRAWTRISPGGRLHFPRISSFDELRHMQTLTVSLTHTPVAVSTSSVPTESRHHFCLTALEACRRLLTHGAMNGLVQDCRGATAPLQQLGPGRAGQTGFGCSAAL